VLILIASKGSRNVSNKVKSVQAAIGFRVKPGCGCFGKAGRRIEAHHLVVHYSVFQKSLFFARIELVSVLRKGDKPMQATHKNCQSCGMPLKKDPQGGGTEANGAKSAMYCSHCYQGGKFTTPDITVSEMQTLVKGKMKEMGFPGFLSGFFTKGIPKLERWKNA
jgi:hypothetical protein